MQTFEVTQNVFTQEHISEETLKKGLLTTIL